MYSCWTDAVLVSGNFYHVEGKLRDSWLLIFIELGVLCYFKYLQRLVAQSSTDNIIWK